MLAGWAAPAGGRGRDVLKAEGGVTFVAAVGSCFACVLMEGGVPAGARARNGGPARW